jgi:hyperosmotically inducible protein
MMKSKILATTAAICLATLSLAGCAGQSVGDSVDDTTITAQVKTALLSEDAMTATGINVETYEGTVALIGYVDTKEDHARAIKAARSVDGVKDVADAMLISPPRRSVGTTIDDQTLEGKVKYAISDMDSDTILSVVTEVRNGEVLLGGFVSSSKAKDQITAAVRAVEGVTKVHNRLHVKS